MIFTYAFTALIIIIYVLDTFVFVTKGVKRLTSQHILDGDKSGHILQALKLSAAKVKRGQVWRLITSALLHVSLSHIAGNAAALLIIGYAVESSLGSVKTLLCFVISSLISALVMTFVYKFDDGEGSSTGIYGLIAVYFLLAVKSGSLLFSPVSPYLLALAGVFFVGGFFSGSVNRREHTSGFIGGIVAGVLMIWIL
ncbi:MAG: rhomboid family intramembrane serine protease [Clostridiales bacterium]|nr:rhomboid family intramembrane serine protease [Clostridiales bacterium]